MNRTPRETKNPGGSRIQAVLFDAVGTLFRSRGTIGEIYRDLAQTHGFSADAGTIDARFARQIRDAGTPVEKAGWESLVRAVFAGLGPFPGFDAFFEDVYEVFRSSAGWRCYPETVSVLEQLREDGYLLGVVSNFDARLHHVLRDLEIDAYFQTVVTPESSGYAKPNPRIFLAAVQSLGVEPSEALFAGDDREQDFQAASRAGLQAVLVVRGRRANPGPGRIQDLSGIQELLETTAGPPDFPRRRH